MFCVERLWWKQQCSEKQRPFLCTRRRVTFLLNRHCPRPRVHTDAMYQITVLNSSSTYCCTWDVERQQPTRLVACLPAQQLTAVVTAARGCRFQTPTTVTDDMTAHHRPYLHRASPNHIPIPPRMQISRLPMLVRKTVHCIPTGDREILLYQAIRDMIVGGLVATYGSEGISGYPFRRWKVCQTSVWNGPGVGLTLVQ